MKPTDGAKIFIKNVETGKYLFVLRDNKPTITNPNKWALFGGGIDPEETPLEGLTRELGEELHIEVADIQQIHQKDKFHYLMGKQYPITAYYFVGTTTVSDISEITFHEGQKIAFFTPEEILAKENIMDTIPLLIGKCEKLYPTIT